MKKIKQIVKLCGFLYFFCLIFFSAFDLVRAGQSYIMKGTSTFRTQPNEGGTWTYVPAGYLTAGDRVTIVDSVVPVVSTNAKCQTSYYYVEYMAYRGYVCGDAISFEASTKYNDLWKELKFPESYWPSLNALKEAHSNWDFEPYFVKEGDQYLDFYKAVQNESIVGKSLINSFTPGWLSTAEASYDHYTDTFKDNFDGKGWYAANAETVAYYLDPRNFLNDPLVFMFVTLGNSSSYTLDGVQSILNGSCLSGNYNENGVTRTYAQDFYEAAQASGVSPYLLAARSRQEVNGSSSCSGSVTGTVSGYEGYYNFFNIGAYSSDGRGAIENGLIYAKNKGWDTRYKSIIGGANFIGSGYINVGQNTLYLQKWDMVGDLYSHQYMTNVQAPKSEAESLAKTYEGISANLTFSVPIYANMPEVTTLPNTGNPNNYLSSLTVNGKLIDQFNMDQNEYTMKVSASTGDVVIGGSAVNSKATVSGFGKINLTSVKQTVTVEVKAQNGSIRNYKINFEKLNDVPISVDDVVNSLGYRINDSYMSGIGLGTSTDNIAEKVRNINGFVSVKFQDVNNNEITNKTIATGQKLVLTSNGETKTYQFIIAGDATGDGTIGLADLLRVQKILLGTTYAEVYMKAADANRNGTVDPADLIRIQKTILGVDQIQQ